MVGRREDGYHELDSLIVFADCHDLIRVEPADRLALALQGPFAGALGDGPDNLVWRAAVALAERAGLDRTGAAISLVKNLPVASGIGGGSADAAATLRALNDFWRAGLDGPTLARLGQGLGADVPVCLFGRTARVSGIGEHIAPGPDLPDFGLLLVNPGVAVSTAAVFSEREGAFCGTVDLPPSFETAAALAGFLSTCRNDLLAPARRLAPEIDTVLADMTSQPGCLFASLSGSGATCFGIFSEPATAAAAASAMRRARSGWWAHGGGILAATPPAGYR